MPDYRYAQFCPLARAAEIVGERWTLLIVRELILGPKRFSDLRRCLPGVSPSVLAERLLRLEERGLVTRRDQPPPTPASLYELGEAGRALVPAVLELVRWGARFLETPQPGDYFDPSWLRLGFEAFASSAATPSHTFEIRVEGHDSLAFCVTGGASGTSIHAADGPFDTSICATSPLALLALIGRQISPADAVRTGAAVVDGDVAAIEFFPDLFDTGRDEARPHPTGE